MSAMKHKIGICGHFANGYNLINGQTIKTKILTEELAKQIGEDQVITIDTYNWKSNPLSLFLKCFTLTKDSENVIVLPAHNGVKILIPLFFLLGKIFKPRIHYIVIGGWLPDLLRENVFLKKIISRLANVFVETLFLKDELNSLGLKNVKVLPNIKELKILERRDINYSFTKPYKLCTFSRVIDEKGIEDAIEVVSNINDKCNDIVYTLDIYGPVDESYKTRFEEIEKNLPDYIKYKGIINYTDTVDTLKDYFALLFPTRYKTEGIPGSIIDAYAAGVPVIASDWNSAHEIVIHGETGFVYEFMNNNELEKILLKILNNPDSIMNMKTRCNNCAYNYTPEAIIKLFLKDLLWD